MRIGRSSSSPQPPVDDRARELAADVGAALALDLEADAPSRRSASPTRVTPGIARSAAAGVAARASTCTYIVSAPVQPRRQVVRRVDRDDACPC